MNKMNKIMFYSTLLMSSLMAISGISWLTIWMGLELNLLSILPLMKDKKMSSSEAMIKYFMVQTMSSSILLFSIVIFQLIKETSLMNSMYLLLNSALLLKMGAAPFHFWYPEIMSGISWLTNFIMMTWQKLAPMILITNSPISINFISIFIMFSILMGNLQGLNQICMRKIMAYSSINHTGWMLSILLTSYSIWILYFMIYSLINMNIMIIMQKMNIFYLNQMTYLFSFNFKLKFMYTLNFLSLMGVPPFLGFMPKWLAINHMIMNDFYTLVMIMVTFTLLGMYMYFRITFPAFSLFYKQTNFLNYFNMKYLIFLVNFLSLMSIAYIFPVNFM
uniref:NADH-ubiquinone oxidoreductase chain 2 n=1 Tax=Coccotorus chaoi TaxID=2978103 RepID=A0A977JPK6_9CUCU